MQTSVIQTGTKEYEAMINLRMKVLLHPIGVPRSYINPEKEKDDLLLGVFDNEKLIGCCILTHRDADTVQLRQMAVDHLQQKKGIGAKLLKFAEEVAKPKGYRTLMMHARDTVTGFYESCGYAVDGGKFFEVGIGHYKMKKQLY